MYPKADIPVLQLSLNNKLPLEKHFEIGKELTKLRDEGVLIIGSGNIVHNLMRMNPEGKPYDWAIEFDEWVKGRLIEKDHNALINYRKQKSSIYAVPTNEHYLPLLYVIGASDDESPQFFNEKLFYASLSMRCVVYGLNKK
jgi:4,5-DOPA dioxygenase extradiol